MNQELLLQGIEKAIEVGDTERAQKYRQAYIKHFGDPRPKVAEESSLTEDMEKTVETRGSELVDIVEAYKPTERLPKDLSIQSILEQSSKPFLGLLEPEIKTGMRVAGKTVVGTAMDTLNNLVTAGYIEAVPKDIRQEIKEVTDPALEAIANSKLVKWIGENYEKLDEETKMDLEASGNLMSVITPYLKPASKVGKVVEKSATKISQDKGAEYLLPKEDVTQKVKRSKKGIKDYRYDYENKMIDDVNELNLSHSNTDRGLLKNISRLNKETGELADKLVEDLSTITEGYKKKGFKANINLTKADFYREYPWARTMDETKKGVKAVDRKLNDIAQSIIKGRKTITPSDLLEIRKQFDDIVYDYMGTNNNINSAIKGYARTARKRLNEMIQKKAPNVNVKESLSKQSSYLQARDNLAFKHASSSGKNILQKAISYGASHPFLMASMTGGSALGFPLAGVAGAGLGLGAGYGAYKGLTSPLTRKALGKSLGLADYLPPAVAVGMQEEE